MRLQFQRVSVAEFWREIERESQCLLARPMCVFSRISASQRGTIENQDDEIVSCRDDGDENSAGAPSCFSTYSRGRARYSFLTRAEQFVAPRAQKTRRDETKRAGQARRWQGSDGDDNAAERNCLKSWIPTGSWVNVEKLLSDLLEV